MKLALYPIPVLVVSVILLIRAEILKEQRQIYVFKPISTLLVIIIALLSFLEPGHNQVYTVGILVGLLLSLGGDVALMFQENRRAFGVGLGLFLLAHVAYTVVFLRMGRFSGWDILSAGLLLSVGVSLYALMQPNLGALRLPVAIYIIVISLMVNRAVSVLAGSALSNVPGVMVVVGAVLFYVSDVILAASRFWRTWRYHRVSLAFYYSGQLLLALAASFVA
ncbi:putative membrane protein [Thermoflexales bacterium]|nr:putative membrane protein [Thermoflexales bacterium]